MKAEILGEVDGDADAEADESGAESDAASEEGDGAGARSFPRLIYHYIHVNSGSSQIEWPQCRGERWRSEAGGRGGRGRHDRRRDGHEPRLAPAHHLPHHTIGTRLRGGRAQTAQDAAQARPGGAPHLILITSTETRPIMNYVFRLV